MIVQEEVYLEHYGKPGMKWGKRRALNKASRDKDWAKQAKQVTSAREKVKSGQVKKEWKKTKVEYKRNKETMGSREARKIMNKKKTKLNETYVKSQQVKTRKGQAAAVTALVVLSGLRIASASRGF